MVGSGQPVAADASFGWSLHFLSGLSVTLFRGCRLPNSVHPVTVYRQRSSVNDPCPNHHHHHHRDADDVALEMTQHPNIWTDGSREDFSSLGGFEVAGAGVHLPASVVAF